jgi:hypothetical protein
MDVAVDSKLPNFDAWASAFLVPVEKPFVAVEIFVVAHTAAVVEHYE